MTNRTSDNEIELTVASLTPQQCEQDRWLTMARYSTDLAAAKNADERVACVERILTKFRDVPSLQPGQQDSAVHAGFAAKTFLEALIKAEAKEQAASMETGSVASVTTENVFNEWIDEWLPPSRSAGRARRQ